MYNSKSDKALTKKEGPNDYWDDIIFFKLPALTRFLFIHYILRAVQQMIGTSCFVRALEGISGQNSIKLGHILASEA